MRLAAYNVENLFDRARIMNLDNWDEGRAILDAFSKAQDILGRASYQAQDKAELVKQLIVLGLEGSDANKNIILRRNRGELLKRPKAGGIEIVADGRADWVGSLELQETPVNHESMINTAKVVADLNADVLGVVEAENRPSLADFNNDIVPAVAGAAFNHVMVIDGNDTRGIDVGLLTKAGYPIVRMASHVDDRSTNGKPIFSRDCPEYEILTPAGNTLYVLVNHFKSKGYGKPSETAARRVEQANRVVEIVKTLLKQHAFIAVVGDLNDTPDSGAIAALTRDGLLKDAWDHPDFDNGGYPGTYGSSNARNKIDYLFLTSELYKKVRAGGVIRKGMWPGTSPKKWEVYDTVKKPIHAASDHAALWVDLDI